MACATDMPTVLSVGQTKATVAGAAGTGTVTFQPTLLGHTWSVRLLSATSRGITVQVVRNKGQIIDTTTDDPRPDVTSDSTYDLSQFEVLDVNWSGATPGQPLSATLTYDETWPD